jgi:hypothetical protein
LDLKLQVNEGEMSIATAGEPINEVNVDVMDAGIGGFLGKLKC